MKRAWFWLKQKQKCYLRDLCALITLPAATVGRDTLSIDFR